MKTPSLLVKFDAIKSDPALKEGERGARKIIVTELCDKKEIIAFESNWKPASPPDKCPVQVMKDTEVAVFNQHAAQDKHYHAIGTEIYMVLEGNMTIEVENEEFQLHIGDMIVVNPNSIHEVKPDRSNFICRVITVGCCGESDKYVV